jgi:DNA-binding NtrC family response regulator
VKVDVRIISATNRDLATLARDGQFREDLYYRLNVFPIVIPPLRDRHEDIPALGRHFIERFAAEEHKAVAGLSPEAADLLERFEWPGNVRQLENTIFRAVVLCDGTSLDVCDFPQIAAAMGVEARVRRVFAEAPAHAPLPGRAPAQTMTSPYVFTAVDGNGHMRKLEDIESEMIRLAISRYDGHMSEVARRLGIGRSTLYRKLKELGLEPSEAENGFADEQPQKAAG